VRLRCPDTVVVGGSADTPFVGMTLDAVSLLDGVKVETDHHVFVLLHVASGRTAILKNRIAGLLRASGASRTLLGCAAPKLRLSARCTVVLARAVPLDPIHAELVQKTNIRRFSVKSSLFYLGSSR
jgi:hypothetical protein